MYVYVYNRKSYQELSIGWSPAHQLPLHDEVPFLALTRRAHVLFGRRSCGRFQCQVRDGVLQVELRDRLAVVREIYGTS